MIPKKTFKYLLLILPVLFLISYILGCGQNPTGGHHSSAIPSWHIETVDNIGYPPCYLVLDKNSLPHICYAGLTSSNDFAYASYEAGVWEKKLVISNHPELKFAVDQNNSPHFFYRTVNNLTHATFEGSILKSDTVKTLVYPNCISAGTNPSGRIFVVYYKTNSGELRFATKEAGTSWPDSLITTASASVTAMAFDTGGNPNICFATSSDIKYARFTGSAWDVQTITAEVTDYVSITVSNSDIPHVCFYAKGQWDLKYSTIVGSTWETQIVESDGLSGKSCSISLDPSGQPHIVYIKSNTYELKHAWWTGATWETEVIDSGDFSSSVMGNFGKPTIVYSSLLQELKFAEYR